MKLFRIHHLLFALGVIAAYLTAEELGLVHAWTGYGVAALLILRIVLGLTSAQGFRFARLNPRAGGAQRPAGLRSPSIANSLTLALALCVAGTAGTGIAMDQGGTLVGKSIRLHDEEHGRGGEDGRGGETGEEQEDAALLPGLIGTARAEDGEGGEGEEEGPLAEVHETLGNLLLPLALLHAAWMLLFRFPLARFVLFLNPRRAKA